MSKRKWKVYTTDELRDRFQPKPGAPSILNEDPQKFPVPNLKRRNSAPPGMIHFPPGTFSANTHNHSHNNIHTSQQQQIQPPSHPHHPHAQPSPPISSRQQHELVTHARSSPTPKPTTSPYPSRLEKRRASLPFMPPPSSSFNIPHNNNNPVPAIEDYLTHLQNIPLPHQDLDMSDEEPSPKTPQSPSQPLPSFQSLLQTIREDADEEDTEIKEIEERAMQGSKSLPVFKENKPQPQLYIQPQQYQTENIINNQISEIGSPSSKFYRSTISKSSENLPALSRMSISDIIG